MKTQTLKKVKKFCKAIKVACIIIRYFAFFTLGCYTSLIIENGNNTDFTLGVIVSIVLIILTLIYNCLIREME